MTPIAKFQRLVPIERLPSTLKRISRALLASVVLGGGVCVHAAPPLTELIDIPTAEALDHYGYSASFRFYTGGGLMTKATFGVFPRLNVGFGLDAERFIGNESVDVNAPTLNARFRFFDGQRNLPALALGYDGQGLFFDENSDHYLQREKGLYLVGSGEVFLPNLSLHAGGNIYDFKEDRVYGFLGIHYLFADRFAPTVEWDNIRIMRESRLSVGGRWYVTPGFAVEMIGRDLAGPSRRAERVVRLTYSGGF